jgi:hypothetical protein
VKDKTSEFENFDRTMRDLIKVSHDELKAKLDEEKATKQSKKQNTKVPKDDKSN